MQILNVCICLCVFWAKCKVYFLISELNFFKTKFLQESWQLPFFFMVQNDFLGGMLPSKVAISLDFFHCFFFFFPFSFGLLGLLFLRNKFNIFLFLKAFPVPNAQVERIFWFLKCQLWTTYNLRKTTIVILHDAQVTQKN